MNETKIKWCIALIQLVRAATEMSEARWNSGFKVGKFLSSIACAKTSFPLNMHEARSHFNVNQAASFKGTWINVYWTHTHISRTTLGANAWAIGPGEPQKSIFSHIDLIYRRDSTFLPLNLSTLTKPIFQKRHSRIMDPKFGRTFRAFLYKTFLDEKQR